MFDDWTQATEFRQTITYTPTTGSPQTLSGVLDPDGGSVRRDSHLSQVRTAKLHVPNTITPTIGDKFTIGGEIWNFHAIEESHLSGLVLSLTQPVGRKAGIR